MERNLLGDGCLEPENKGLTNFGMQVVRECNRLGILIDCSHVGRQTSLDAARLSQKPIVISHTAVRAITENPRCVTDEQMKTVAQQGRHDRHHHVLAVHPHRPTTHPGRLPLPLRLCDQPYRGGSRHVRHGLVRRQDQGQLGHALVLPRSHPRQEIRRAGPRGRIQHPARARERGGRNAQARLQRGAHRQDPRRQFHSSP